MLSLDELRWLHATQAILDDPPLRPRCPRGPDLQRHRHYHLLGDTDVPAAPSPRRPTSSLIPAPVRPAQPPPAPTQWIYRSPKRPSRVPAPAPIPPPLCRAPSARPLSAKDREKERGIWTMLGLADHRASSASSTSTASASTPPTSPSPSVPASPKPSSAPTKSILSRSASASSRPTPQRSLAALFSRGTSSASVTSSVKSVTFVDEPTVHYPDQFDTESDHNHSPLDDDDDLAARLTNGALAWEMGLDIDTMDLDLSLDVAPSVNLDAPLELDMGQKYVPPKRDGIAGILEEDEDAEDAPPTKHPTDSLKRFWSLGAGAGAAPKTERKLKRRSAPLPTRPPISAPFALGLPPAARSVSLTALHTPASRSSTSLRSTRARSASDTHALPARPPPRSPASASAPCTPVHAHPHRAPRRPRTANASPTSTTSSLGFGFGAPAPAPAAARCSPYVYVSSLHTAPSLESFRSAAGRSVRSLGSIRSTASARSAFRALLGRIGIGGGGGAEE